LLIPKVGSGKNIQLKEYEIPKDIIFVDELPRIEGSEKIDYLELEKRVQADIKKQKLLIK